MKWFVSSFVILLVASLAIATQSAPADSETSILKVLERLPLKPGERAYVVEDGQAYVDEDVISQILIGGNKIAVTFQNKTSAPARPKNHLAFYNSQGLLLRLEQISDVYIGIHDIESKNYYNKPFPVDRIIDRSGMTLPEDWQVVKWVVISDPDTPSKRAQDKSAK